RQPAEAAADRMSDAGTVRARGQADAAGSARRNGGADSAFRADDRRAWRPFVAARTVGERHRRVARLAVDTLRRPQFPAANKKDPSIKFHGLARSPKGALLSWDCPAKKKTGARPVLNGVPKETISSFRLPQVCSCDVHASVSERTMPSARQRRSGSKPARTPSTSHRLRLPAQP